jgi:hypothetical protein
VDVLTMMVGTGKVLVCARVDYTDELSATQAEQACVRIHEVLTTAFPDIDNVFIEPVPGSDRGLRDEARSRAER